MPATIEVYYDFRSPYAYFASHRIRSTDLARQGHGWKWQPVSIDVLLNLQAEREPWAPYLDPLPGPKRVHLIADVRRLAAYYRRPLRPTKPQRPNSVPALCLAGLVEDSQRGAFNDAAFAALWEQQQDISTREVLQRCLAVAGAAPALLDSAFQPSARARLAEETTAAYARGIFGVPTFVVRNEVFFGNDRLDLLLWSIEPRA